jgi:hypothetical protein
LSRKERDYDLHTWNSILCQRNRSAKALGKTGPVVF